MNSLAFELQQFMLTWNILNIKFYRTLEIESVFHKQMKWFNKIDSTFTHNNNVFSIVWNAFKKI